MNSTYTLTEGNDALNRALLMMRYDLSKTLNENVVLEQPESRGAFGYNPWSKDPNNLKDSMKRQSEYIKIDAPTLSEVLLKTREVLFTPGGMTAQIVLSILGAEIGLPIVFEILDIAIIINDFSIMVKNWKSSEYKPWSWEWFEYQYNNNEGFALVLEDIAILLTLGFVKLVGKGAKAAWRYFKPLTKNVAKMVEVVEKGIAKKTPFIKKLPKKISSFCMSKINQLKKGIELLKTPKQAARSVVRQMPKAVAAGVLNYGFLIFFDKYIMPKLVGGKTETTNLIPTAQENKELIDYLWYNNPQYFPKGIKQIAIVSGKDKKMGYFKIDGNVYVLTDPKNFKLKKE